MTTVLSGKTLASKSQFFDETGTSGANPRSNPKALVLWLAQLKSEANNQPVGWIKQMIRNPPYKRVTAAHLMDQIRSLDGHMYYNSCCDREEEEISYQGSVLEKDANVNPEDPIEVREGFGAESAVLPMSSRDLRGGLIRHGELLDGESQIEVGNASDLEMTGAQATLVNDEFDIRMSSSKTKELLWAAQNGDEAVIKLLLQNGVDLTSKNNHGRTALNLAAESGHEAAVKLLLENGADVAAEDNSGWTALHWAAEYGHEVVIKLLLEAGANTAVKDVDGRMALSWAAENGHEAVTKLLLERGANIAVKDNGGWTALHWAAENGHGAVIKLLLERGADVAVKDNDGWTALHWAAENGHEAAVKELLEGGADVAARDIARRTALNIAVNNGHKVVAEILRARADRRWWWIF